MPNIVWSELERDFIRKNVDKLTDKEGAEELSKLVNREITMVAYRRQRNKMKIVKKHGRGHCEVDKDKTLAKGGYIKIERYVPAELMKAEKGGTGGGNPVISDVTTQVAPTELEDPDIEW